MKRIFRNISLIMCTIILTFVGCKNKLETVNNDSNNNETESEVVSGTINGHEYVDLGLPSGTKWATCNVGANNPEEYGDYYAWGETMAKSEYTEENCVTCGERMDDISGDTNYDVARAIWGESWRMPTRNEMKELKNECTWEYITLNGIKGMKVTGSNGNNIFLPAAGYKYRSLHFHIGDFGYYWSSTPTPKDSSNLDACYQFFYSANHYNYRYLRYDGLTVRPVSD